MKIEKGHFYMDSYGRKVLATSDEMKLNEIPVFVGVMEQQNQAQVFLVFDAVSECTSQFPLYDLDGNLFLLDAQEAYDAKLAEIHGDLKEWSKVNYEVKPKQEEQ